MRWITFKKNESKHTAEIGLKVDTDRVLVWDRALKAAGAPNRPSSSLLEIVSGWHVSELHLPETAQKILDWHQDGRLPPQCYEELGQVQVIAPLPRPLSFRDGYAFRQHVETSRQNRGLDMIPEFDAFPVFYFSNHLAIQGPGPIAIPPSAFGKLDFELEVAAVIGKGGRDIPASEADSHIFGYMILNDWSARDLQMDEMKLNLGPAKGKDFATSMGPELVTRDELLPHRICAQAPKGEKFSLTMRARLNGELISEGNLADMHWSFAQIIARASQGVELFPGEIIGSGTVGTGCLLEINGTRARAGDNAPARWLQPGDQISLEVQELGVLSNQINAAS